MKQAGFEPASSRRLVALLLAAALACGLGAGEAPGPSDAEALLERARAEFAAVDRDGNQLVTRDEFLAWSHEADREERARSFGRFDRDGDGRLSRSEFFRFWSPTDERGEIRDPVVELEGRARAKWEAIFAAAGGGDALTPDRWPADQIARQIPALAEVTFDQWDRIRDGKVDAAEGRRLLEVAYGLTLPDGRRIRTPQGRVFSWYYFRAIDANGDGVVSQNEFLSHHHEGREKSAALFPTLDGNRDGKLIVEETRDLLWHDTLAWFFWFDGNNDGYLNNEEFLAIGWGANLAKRAVRAFDADGDDKLSFSEFRNTTFTNEASDWMRIRRDADHDGRLSFKEFYLEQPPFMIAQTRWLFDHFDLDRDGFLSTAEFDFEAGFAKSDTDRDGQLTLAEFTRSVPDTERADRTRCFLVFDFDGNGKLDAEEYRAFSSPVDERGKVPDPMAEFAEAALAKWQAVLAAADRNHDGALSTTEWPAKEMRTALPELADVPFVLWDRGQDGKVDRADARWLVDVAYGLAKLDGRPLRTPTGRMFAWYFFRRHDRDRNGLLSQKEFVGGYHPGNVNIIELFERLDADGDGELTHEETWSVFWHDTVGTFLAYDRNQDSYLTADEIRAIGWGYYLARRTVPVFDDDGDGKLSFREFRLTNFANQAADWWQLRDLNNDGRISWDEFYREKPPLLVGQSRFYFNRFDRNHDGFLSAFEFPSEADPSHGQLFAHADALERVLPLEMQFARRICGLTNEDADALEQEGYSAIERLVGKSAVRLRKTQTGGTAAGRNSAATSAGTTSDLAIVQSPHLLLRRELAEALRGRMQKGGDTGDGSPAEGWQKLDAERGRADKRRRQAAVVAQVALLDDVLLLSAGQRSELCDLLAEDASDAWWRQINSGTIIDPSAEWFLATVASNGFYELFVPDAELKKRLTPSQWAAFTQLQQPYEQEIVIVQQAVPKLDIRAPRVVAGGAAPAAAPAPPMMARPAPARMARRIVRQGPTVEEQQRRLTHYLGQRLDDIEAACGLSKPQRDKLSLAAKLDLAAWRDRSTPPDEKLNEGEELVVRKGQVRGGSVPLPLAVFSDEDSYFQKSLSRLPDDQKQKLAEADRQRRAFHRQALVAAVVAGFERTASLDSSQCEALTALLSDWLAEGEAGGEAEWVRRIAQLPFERLQPIFFDFQLAAAQLHYDELDGALRQFEQQRNMVGFAGAAAGGGGRF